MENKLRQREMVIEQRHEDVQRKKADLEQDRVKLDNSINLANKKREELEKLQQKRLTNFRLYRVYLPMKPKNIW